MGMKCLYRLQLERTDLCHADGFLSGLRRSFRIGITDIPYHMRVLLTDEPLHQISEQGNRSRFSVGSGHGQNLPL